MNRTLDKDGALANYANVGIETSIGGLSKGEIERMARRRFQAPKPKRRGKWWCLLYWQDEFVDGRRVRRRKRINLAPADTPEREVYKMAAEHLRPMNQGLITVGSPQTSLTSWTTCTFRWCFLRWPELHKAGTWGSSTTI